MLCKYCGLPMPDDAMFCPYCGKNNQESDPEIAAQVEALLEEDGEAVIFVSEGEEAPEEMLIPEEEAPEQETPEQEAASAPEVKKMKRMAMLSGCAAALVLLGTLLFLLVKGEVIDTKKLFNIRKDTLLANESYSVSDGKAYTKRNTVVATLGQAELTNGQLQIYYWMEVYNFLNEYGGYLTYFGLDYTKPLDEQDSGTGDGSWQHYFLQTALEAWQRDRTFYMEAQKAGFQLDADYREMIDGMAGEVEEMAQKDGYDDANEYLQSSFGAGCTVEDYVNYWECYYTCSMYFTQLYTAINPTDEEIDAYFENNKDAFTKENITKESGLYYTVRHVFVKLEGGTQDESGNTVYSEVEWDLCREKAQAIYDAWLAGEHTEDTFFDLAQKNSNDADSKDDGGLLESFVKGDIKANYGQAMEDWCVAEDRQAGDHALVKGDGGYHIVYYVENAEIWYQEARDALVDDLGAEIVKQALDSYTLDVDYKKIVLGVMDLA